MVYKEACLTSGRRAGITLLVLDKGMQNCSAQHTDEKTHLFSVGIWGRQSQKTKSFRKQRMWGFSREYVGDSPMITPLIKNNWYMIVWEGDTSLSIGEFYLDVTPNSLFQVTRCVWELKERITPWLVWCRGLRKKTFSWISNLIFIVNSIYNRMANIMFKPE